MLLNWSNSQGLNALMNSAEFILPLTTDYVLSRGTGSATYTRATTATVTDHENVVIPVLSGEARFQGARRVRNWISTTSEDFSNAVWAKTTATITSGVTAPDGSLTAYTLRADGVNSAVNLTAGTTHAIGDIGVGSIWIRRRTGTGTIDVRCGPATYIDITAAVGTSWKRVSVNQTLTDANMRFTIRLQTSGDEVDIWHAQAENVTGQSNQAPGEYVSVGAAKLNELTYTQDFDNAAWSKTGSTVTANSTAAPDGTVTADTLVWASGTAPQVTRNETIASGAQVSFSCYMKAGTKSAGDLILFVSGANYIQAPFDLAAGTAGAVTIVGAGFSSATTTVTAAGNGWYRCELQCSTTSVTTVGAWIRAATALGAGDSIYIWGAQLKQGSTAGDYFPVANVYPFHGAGVDGVKYFSTTNGNSVSSNVVTEASGSPISASTLVGYVAEGARTNLALSSQDMRSAGAGNPVTFWTNTDITVNQAAIAAPDGTTTGNLVTAGTAGTENLTCSVTGTADATYTFTRFFKYGNNQWVRMIFANSTNLSQAWFDIQNGVVGTASNGGTGSGATASIVAYPNGWYRCTLTGAVGSGATLITTQTYATSGNGVGTRVNNSTYYTWGAQFENSSAFASTYIPTTTASVTRNTDLLTYQFAGNASASVGSAYAELSTFWGAPSAAGAITFGSGTSGSPLWGSSSPTQISSKGLTSSTAVKSGLTSMQTGVRKRASSWSSTSNSVTGDGASPATVSADATMDSVAICIGNFTSSGFGWFGTIRNVRIYQNQFSASQLQSVTS